MMSFDKHAGELFRVVRWASGIKGAKRSFQLRTMTRDGHLWFTCQDVQKALGWSRQELEKARRDRLEGNTWGTTHAQWHGRGPRLAFISLTALSVVMAGRKTRHNRFFLRWLDGLEDVAEPVDKGDFAVDLPTNEDHSGAAYLHIGVDHACA